MVSSHALNLALFWLLGIGLTQLKISKTNSYKQFWQIFIKGGLIIGLIYLVMTAVGYLATPLFFDHGEASTASIAANWLRGGEMYTSFDSANQYTLLYGPWPLLLVAQSLRLGTSAIFLAKLPGVINLISSLILFFWLTRRFKLTNMERSLFTATLAVMMLGYYNFSYFIRPDSFLLFNMLLGLVVVEKVRSPILAYVLLGLLTALSFNCKINAPIYFIPVCVYYLESGKDRWSLRALAIGLAALAFGVLFPFLLPRISFNAFYDWIRLPWVGENQHWPWSDTGKGVTYGLALLFVLYSLGVYQKYRWTFISLTICSLIVGVLSATPGSWVHMYLPLMPFFVWLSAELYAELDVQQRNVKALMLSAMALTLMLNGINRQKRMVELFSQTPQRWQEFNDLKSLTKDIEGPLEVGYTSIAQYEMTFYKPWFVHNGFGYFLDACALMKILYSGVKIPASTIEKVKRCEVPHMVLPKGDAPWSLGNWYDHKPLLPENLKQALLDHYSPVRSSKFYELYECHM